jgi:hypothetical protein
MYAVEFNANIMNGMIQVPARYQRQFSTPHNVKVILLKQEAAHLQPPQQESSADAGFGVLSRYANPALWEQEDGAWERAAVEKHDAR